MYSSFSTPWRPQPLFSDSPSWLNSSASAGQFANASVHLSPEELAAIEHGIASVYGKFPDAELEAGFVPNRYGTVFENENVNVNGNLNGNWNGNVHGNWNGHANGNANVNTFNSSNGNSKNNNNNNNNNNPPPTMNQPAMANTPQVHTPYHRTANSNNTSTPAPAPAHVPLSTPPFNNTFAGKENFAAPSPKILDDLLSPPGTAAQADKLLLQERQRYAAMEQHYRRELERLKRDNLEYSERLRLEQTIQDLRKRVADLEAQLQQARKQPSDDRLAALQLHYDRKIALLTRQFEQEKTSHAEIMRARMKSEMNLLIPKIRAQCQAAMERSSSDAVSRLKAQASSYISKLKQDFELEKQVLREHLKRRFYQDLRTMSAQMQQKFELKLAQERNALERRYLERREQRQTYSNSGSNNAFNLEPSFLL